MGKGIDQLELKKRSDKLAFMEVKGTDGTVSYVRMEAFTDLGTSKNTKEHTVQFVDEDTDRTDVIGYSESISYEFEHFIGQPVLEEIVSITENELVGLAAVRNIVTVDMSKIGTSHGGNLYTAYATKRAYAIVPGSSGTTTDCMTYSGDFKSRGEIEHVQVSFSGKKPQTVTIVNSTEATSLATINQEE